MTRIATIAVAAAAVAAGVAAPGAAAAEQGTLLDFSRSSSMRSNNTDLINGEERPGTLLRIGAAPFAVRSVPLGDVEAGEEIKVLSEVEVTNDLVSKDGSGANVLWTVLGGLTIVIADSPAATTGIELAEAQSSYVTPQVHHWTFEKSATYTAPSDLSGKYVNLVMWASMPDPPDQCWTFPRSSQPSPQQPRDCGLDVNYDRGHLSVLRFGPPGVAPAGAEPFSVADFSGTSVPEATPPEVPVTYAGESARYVVALSRPVGGLEAGDVITAHSELQVDARDPTRSSASCNVGFASRLYLSPHPDSLDGATPIGTEAGYNFTGRGGHPTRTLEQGVVPSSTALELGQDYAGPMYVVLRVWAVGNWACATYGNGLGVRIAQGSSFMHVARYRREDSAGLVPDTLNSGDDSEQAAALDVVTHTPVSVYSVPLVDLAAGDYVEALAEVQLETVDRRAGIFTDFVLADSPDATTGLSLQVDDHTEISPYMQQLPIHAATGWTVPSAIGGVSYVNLVVRGEGLGRLGDPPPDSVSIAPDGGRLAVQRFRPPDLTPPETTIDSGPSGAVADATPSFDFSASETLVDFECRFDAAAFAGCSGPGASHTAAGALPDGTHTFEVRATDAAGNVEPDPATRAFAVDTRPPETAIDSGPPGATNDATPSFSFSSDEPGSSFRCRIDSGADEDCSGGSFTPAGELPDGSHVFEVHATDAVGNDDATPASSEFEVDTKAPATSVVGGPDGPTNDPTPAFRFSAGERVLGFECRIDSAPFAPCSGPGATHHASALADGPHVLRVRATDVAGNVEPDPASRSFSVDTTAPNTAIRFGPRGWKRRRRAVFGLRLIGRDAAGDRLQCRLDRRRFRPCGRRVRYRRLALGRHLLRARAVDAAGNVDPTPARRIWRVFRRKRS